MEFSPCRSSLYRKRQPVVTLAALSVLAVMVFGGPRLLAQGPATQYGRKAKADLGPRALGLVQLLPNGKKGRFIPIAIMIDGKFYDAGSYKASPVPMALDFDTVYEGFRSGVSQGLFTITQPGQLNHNWIAEGTWLPAGEVAAQKSKKYSTPVIEDKDDGPPVLHRHSGSDADSTSTAKDASKDAGKDASKDAKPGGPPTPTATPTTTTPPASTSAPAPNPTPDSAKTAPPEEAAKPRSASTDETISDPNRPRLRRGKPDPSAHREPYATFDALTDVPTTGGGKSDADAPKDKDKDKAAAATPEVTSIPAISDANGADPRPYLYEMRPADEELYRNKMLDLVGTLVGSHAGAPPPSKKIVSRKLAAKFVKPIFDEPRLRYFDLSSSNEPVLILSAKTHPPAGATGGADPQEITLIARVNLEGEIKKLFFSQTDSHHLDVAPRMELIDAVDADGDGRGELLFRRINDDGAYYAIYRVTADRLWPLFEGTP